jgi:hypothetical protein
MIVKRLPDTVNVNAVMRVKEVFKLLGPVIGRVGMKEIGKYRDTLSVSAPKLPA